MLALLAVNFGSVVRTERIIEELWDDRPPTSALTTLQTYVYQLRKLLDSGRRSPSRGGDERGPLQTTPGGYILQLPPEALDVARFEQLVVRGRALFESGQLEEASGALRSALQVWSGPALSDIGIGPVLQAESLRLEELRAGAIEQRIEADLALGQHLELIGELTGLVAAHPTHEGLQAKLMLALYRAGRRSEALQAYQRARAVLSAELGLEPARELRDLHRAVLAADPSIETPAARNQTWLAPPVTTILPQNIGNLISRDEPLVDCRSTLTARPRAAPPVVVVSGPPGIGSSAFCVRSAHDVQAEFPDGQLFATMLDEDGTPADSAAVLTHFLRTLRVPTRGATSLPELATIWNSWTARRAVLVVLDDVVAAEQIAPVIPGGARCATLVSSRRRIAAPMISAIVELAALPHDAALDLLVDILGSERVTVEPGAVRELTELCGGLPLALRAAAARLMLRPHWSVSHLVARLRALADPIFGLSAEGLDLVGSVRRTYRLLPPPTRQAFDVLAASVLGPVDVRGAAALLGVDEDRAEELLEELVEFQLVAVEAPAAAAGGFRYRLRSTMGMRSVPKPSVGAKDAVAELNRVCATA